MWIILRNVQVDLWKHPPGPFQHSLFVRAEQDAFFFSNRANLAPGLLRTSKVPVAGILYLVTSTRRPVCSRHALRVSLRSARRIRFFAFNTFSALRYRSLPFW